MSLFQQKETGLKSSHEAATPKVIQPANPVLLLSRQDLAYINEVKEEIKDLNRKGLILSGMSVLIFLAPIIDMLYVRFIAEQPSSEVLSSLMYFLEVATALIAYSIASEAGSSFDTATYQEAVLEEKYPGIYDERVTKKVT